MNLVEFIKNILVMLTLGSNIILIVLLVLWTGRIWSKQLSNYWQSVHDLILKYGMHFGLVISLTAMLGSLFYSDIAQFAPCKLCWYQRVLMYPQVLIFLLAIVRAKVEIIESAKWLSLLGMIMALYHYSLQVAPVKSETCLSVGYSVSCSSNFAMNLGYITIPFMAFSAFLLIFIFTTIVLNHEK